MSTEYVDLAEARPRRGQGWLIDRMETRSQSPDRPSGMHQIHRVNTCLSALLDARAPRQGSVTAARRGGAFRAHADPAVAEAPLRPGEFSS